MLAAVVLALALLVVPAAEASGPSITYTVTSGTLGDNGWYRTPVSAQINVQGAIQSDCPAIFRALTSSDLLSCSATDGNATQTFQLQFKIDTDAPTVGGSAAARAADSNGWYNHPLTVTFAGADATSGIASCTSATYGGPDSGSASVVGTCRDNAGNVSAPASFAIKYDSTPPSVSAAAARPPDANGWFDHPVAVSFSGSDGGSGIGSCTGNTTYGGPDSGAASVGGSCVDQAGNRASASFALKYDATPPTATATLARKPDAKGFYTHPVGVTFAGTDALSGIDGCTAAQIYSGPDRIAARVDGTCRDNAGNSTSVSASLRYDSTAPRLGDVAVTVGDGSATLSWRQPRDTSAVTVTRTPGRSGAHASAVYRGRTPHFRDAGLRAGVAYRYTLTSSDEAGNEARTVITADVRALYAPAPGARVKAGGRLAWVAKRGARYYNLQIFRNGRKVMTTWPVMHSFRLPRRWTFDGHAQTLRRGTYRWYVWPGIGMRSRAHYGRLLGGSFFRVR
ncbi:MAG: hypothetical protein ACRDM1_05135 [Gaiellaceae bacterium]